MRLARHTALIAALWRCLCGNHSGWVFVDEVGRITDSAPLRCRVSLSVPSYRRISGSAEFWPAVEKMRPPKTPPNCLNVCECVPVLVCCLLWTLVVWYKYMIDWWLIGFRKSVSRRKNAAKFGWVGLYRKCINWLSFSCPHLLLQTMLNAIEYCGIALVANGKRSNLSAKKLKYLCFVHDNTSCFSDCDINIDCIITTVIRVIIALHS